MSYPKPKQFYIDEALDKKLAYLVSQTGDNISNVIREAIEQYFFSVIEQETTD